MATDILPSDLLQLSDESLSDGPVQLTREDKILLLACRRYIEVTQTTPDGFCHELFDLASQFIDHQGKDFLSMIKTKAA